MTEMEERTAEVEQDLNAPNNLVVHCIPSPRSCQQEKTYLKNISSNIDESYIEQWTAENENDLVDDKMEEWIKGVEAKDEQQRLLAENKKLKQLLAMVGHYGQASIVLNNPAVIIIPTPRSCQQDEPQPMDWIEVFAKPTPMDTDEFSVESDSDTSEIINHSELECPSLFPSS